MSCQLPHVPLDRFVTILVECTILCSGLRKLWSVVIIHWSQAQRPLCIFWFWLHFSQLRLLLLPFLFVCPQILQVKCGRLLPESLRVVQVLQCCALVLHVCWMSSEMPEQKCRRDWSKLGWHRKQLCKFLCVAVTAASILRETFQVFFWRESLILMMIGGLSCYGKLFFRIVGMGNPPYQHDWLVLLIPDPL